MFYYYIYIRCSLLAQTFEYRGMDVRVLGRSFNYVVTQEIYYTLVLVWIVNVAFCKGVPKLTQDLNLIQNTVFSIDYVIFLLNYKVHRIGLFVEKHIRQMSSTALHAHTHSSVEIFHDYFA